jgi:hypothetical protein
MKYKMRKEFNSLGIHGRVLSIPKIAKSGWLALILGLWHDLSLKGWTMYGVYLIVRPSGSNFKLFWCRYRWQEHQNMNSYDVRKRKVLTEICANIMIIRWTSQTRWHCKSCKFCCKKKNWWTALGSGLGLGFKIYDRVFESSRLLKAHNSLPNASNAEFY